MAVPIVPGAPTRMAGVRLLDTNSLFRLRDTAAAKAKAAPTRLERLRATVAAGRFSEELLRRGAHF